MLSCFSLAPASHSSLLGEGKGALSPLFTWRLPPCLRGSLGVASGWQAPVTAPLPRRGHSTACVFSSCPPAPLTALPPGKGHAAEMSLGQHPAFSRRNSRHTPVCWLLTGVSA